MKGHYSAVRLQEKGKVWLEVANMTCPIGWARQGVLDRKPGQTSSLGRLISSCHLEELASKLGQTALMKVTSSRGNSLLLLEIVPGIRVT